MKVPPRFPKRGVHAREAIYAYGTLYQDGEPTCWLKPFSVKERACYGRLERAHLIPKQLLKREGHRNLCPDPRTWVPACRTHHLMFDTYTGVEVPREELPAELERLCDELGLSWWLDRRYGSLEVVE